MIDTSSAKWDLSKEELYAINWFNQHGFDGRLEKQFVSKSIFVISKDNITDKFELMQGVKNMDIRAYMNQYERNWKMLCELSELRKKVQK